MKKNKIDFKHFNKPQIWLSIAFILILPLALIFYNYYNSFQEFAIADSNGFMISNSINLDSIKNTNDKDKDSVKELSVLELSEQDKIYKASKSYYVNEDLNKNVNVDYPLFINEGLSIINYNDNTNLIDSTLDRIPGLTNHVFSYGNAYQIGDYTITENPYKYLLLSYDNGLFINLFDVIISKSNEEIKIPINSILYFSKDYIGYYERIGNGFILKEILNVDLSNEIKFLFESNNESYSYKYEDFLSGIGKLYIKKIIIPDKPIINEEDQIEDKVDDIVTPIIDKDKEKQESFKWIKPSVTADNFSASVYLLNGRLNISDPARVIVSPPTFTIFVNGKTYSRRSYATSTDFTITGLPASTTFQIVGQYVYLDSDMTTKIKVTFYSNTFTTKDIDELSPIRISFGLGEIHSRNIELSNLKIESDLDSETLKGVKSISFSINGEDFYFASNNIRPLLNGNTIETVSSSEGLNSNSEYDFSINFYDQSGNKLNVLDNKGHTRTSKKEPFVVLKVARTEVDFVDVTVDTKNDDEVNIGNYQYRVTNTAGEIIKTGNVEENIRLLDLDPNQVFNMSLYGDYDLNDDKGLMENMLLGSMDFTTLPITSLGFLNFTTNVEDVTKNSATLKYRINLDKTDARLAALLKELTITLLDKNNNVKVLVYKLSDLEIEKLKNYGEIALTFNNLTSNTQFEFSIDSVVKQGETTYELESITSSKSFETRKNPANVIIENSFATGEMIDFDIKVIDVDRAVLSSNVRIELRDNTNNLIDVRSITPNAEDFERVTYYYLKPNMSYTIYVIAEEYNETNSNSTYISKYQLAKLTKYTEEGISGKIELISSLRDSIGENLVDKNSEVKWVQTYNYYTIPKTIDSEGNMHIYSKTGASSYLYDLSDYYGEVVTATFKIKAITPLNTDYYIYFTNYLTNTTSTNYGMRLDNISENDWTSFTYTFRVGSYKSGNHFIKSTDTYYGKLRACFAGFYLTNGSSQTAEYEIKDFEIHISKTHETVDISDFNTEKGSYNSNGTKNNSNAYINSRARLNRTLELEGSDVYSFEFGDDPNYSAYIYFTDTTGKYLSAYGWFSSGCAIYIPRGVRTYIIFRYYSGNVDIDPNNINLKVTKYKDKNKVEYQDYQYDFNTKVKVNLEDKNNEITDNSYYIRAVDENGNEVFSNRYLELKDTNEINDIIKIIDLEENKKYTIYLSIMIRNRVYDISFFDIETSAEVKGISNTNDWAYIQPNGYYIAINDIDFRGFTLQSIGWGYKYYYGTLDFQGYKAIVDNANTYQRIGRIEKSGVLKNLVLEAHLNNTVNYNSTQGFVSSNYGTIENVSINIYDDRETKFNDLYVSFLVGTNQGSGIIRNFSIKLCNELNLYADSALLTRYNYGLVENGYVYGKDVEISNANESATYRSIGLIERYGGAKSIVRNVYINTSYSFPNNYKYDKTGLVAYETYGQIYNVYTVGNTNNIAPEVGPIVGIVRNTGSLSNAYYYSDYVYTMSNQNKINELNLNDITFQNSVLTNNFNIDDVVKMGYFPQVIYSTNKMPSQEFVELPKSENNTLIDIITMNVDSKTNNSAIIKMVLNNPEGDEITSIGISDLTTTIINQEFENEKTYLTLRITNPQTFVSRYAIRNVSARSYNKIYSTRTYNIGEKYLYVDLYKEISTVKEWNNINNNLSQNYILMNDLDFRDYTNYYLNTFTGKLNGNNHSIKNIIISGSKNGLISSMNGTLENIVIENVYKDSNSTYSGIIGSSNATARYQNVHVKNVVIDTPSNKTSDTLYFGGLVGYFVNARMVNCSITNVRLTSSQPIADIYVGGLVGYSSGGLYNNVFAQDVKIDIQNATSTPGIGGIVGYEASSVATIINAYSTGDINSSTSNIGGIVGFTNGYVQNTMSSMNIVSNMSKVGGIVGNAATPSYITDNIFYGNLTSKVSEPEIGRIISNSAVPNTNYAIETGLINGQKSTETRGEILLSYNELTNKELFENGTITLGEDFDYSEIHKGLIPKLYLMDTDELMPYQNDNKIYIDILGLNNMLISKYADHALVRLYLDNPDNYIIDEVIIDSAETTIQNIVSSENVTYLELDVKPKKYYDSYQLSKIVYHKDNEDREEVQKFIKIDMTFYKNLSTYEDWQNVSTTDAENYLLVNNIDFTDLDVKTNVVFNRLESPGDNIVYTIKGIKSDFSQTGHYKSVIKSINSSLKNISFEDINVTNSNTSTSYNYTNFIGYVYGTIYNVGFNNITIDAPNKNRVAIIGHAMTSSIDNINMNDINVTGRNYTGGLIAYYPNENASRTIRNINATNITISSIGNYVGGIFASFNAAQTENTSSTTNITIKDSTITSENGQYVGAIGGYAGSSDSTVDNVKVNGGSYVGGAFGYGYNNYIYNVAVINSEVTGKTSYIGGIAGQARYLNDCEVKDSKVYGSSIDTNGVGGILGYSSGYSSYRNSVQDTTIINNGKATGGIVGYLTGGTIGYSSINNVNVLGKDFTGGIAGEQRAGTISSLRVTNSNINSTGMYAGGLTGYFNNENNSSILREGAFQNGIVAKSNITANEYAGGLIGGKNTELVNTNNEYNLYFEGNVVSEVESTSGIASGDDSNKEIYNMGRTGFYEDSTVNYERIGDLIKSYDTDENLVIELTKGFINETTGKEEINYTYPDASYTNYIKLDAHKTYRIKAYRKDMTDLNIMRVRLYDTDYKYLTNLYGTPSASFKYFGDYFTFSNLNEEVLRPIRDCFIRVQYLYEVENPAVTIIDNNYDDLYEGRLLDAGELRTRTTWNRYFLDNNTQDFYYTAFMNFSETYFDFSVLNSNVDELNITDKSIYNHNTKANVAVIRNEGLMLNGIDDQIQIDDYEPSDNITISTTIASYGRKSYQYVFSYKSDIDNSNGIGLFINSSTIYVRINGTNYSTNRAIPLYKFVNITMTYENSKIIKIYLDGNLIYENNLSKQNVIKRYENAETYIGHDTYYNTNSYKFIGIIKNTVVYDRILDANEIYNNYSLSSITNEEGIQLNYDFSKYAYENEGYYPILKWSTSDILVKNQALVPLPNRVLPLTSNRRMMSSMLRKSLSISKVPVIDNYNIYSSGANTINIEFDELSSDLNFTYYFKGEEYSINNLDKRVYTLYYDYNSDASIVLQNAFTSIEINIKELDLSKNISIVNGNYYHVENGDLYKNDERIFTNIVNMYDNLALCSDGSIYDVISNKVYDNPITNVIYEEAKPLHKSFIDDSIIDSYYNFSTITNADGDVVYRSSQLIAKDNYLYVINPNEDVLNDTVIVNTYNFNKYEFALGKNGEIYSYKTAFNSNKYLLNEDISEIYADKNSNTPVILIKYKGGSVVAVDYYAGEELYSYGEKETIGLLQFIRRSFTSAGAFSPVSESYVQSSKMVVDLESITDKTITDKLSINTKSNDNLGKTIVDLDAKYIDTTIKNDYISVYNDASDEYQIYSVKEIINSDEEKIPSIEEKIKADKFLYDYFYTNNKSNELVKNNKIIIYIGIVALIIMNLLFLIFKLKKKEEVNS